MKKVRLIAILLSIVTVAGLAGGCQNTKVNQEQQKQLNSEKCTKITFIRAAHDAKKADDAYNIAMKQYKEKYNVDVEIIPSDYNNYSTKLEASLSSGTPIDVAVASVANFPDYAVKGWVQPIDKYISLDSGDYSKSAMDMFYKYKGSHYLAVSKKGITPIVLYYNKDMIADAGLTDPMEYWNKGQWNFETFRTMCKALTKDTNGDGKTDVWGVSCWYPNAFLGANKTAALMIDEKNHFKLNLDDPKLKRACAYVQDMYYTTKWRGLDGNDIKVSWENQHDAFFNEYTWNDKAVAQDKTQGKFTFNYGVVAMPTGPDNTDGTYVCFTGGCSIVKGSKSPWHAGAFIDMATKAEIKATEDVEKTLPKEQVAMYDKMREKPYNDTYYDSIIDNASALMAQVCGPKSIDAAIAVVKNNYQATVDATNQDMDNPSAD